MHNGYQSDQGEAPGGPLGPPDSRDEFCKDLRGLSKGQSKLCLLYEDHMPHVGRGALMGIEECQYQFRDMKWNCSTTHDDSVLGPVLNQGNQSGLGTSRTEIIVTNIFSIFSRYVYSFSLGRI